MKNIILFALLGISVSLHAQNNDRVTLSLQQAMKLGLKNRFDAQANRYEIRLAENNIHRNRNVWIPDVHVEGNVQYNAQLQPTYVPKGFAGFTEPEMLAFGAENKSSIGLSLNQPVFKPGINTDIKIAKTNLALQKEKIHGDEIDIKNSIASAYFEVLLKKLQYKITQDEESRFKEYKALAEGKYKNGALIENDYLRTKLDYENAKVKTETTLQSYKLAKDYLKYQINVPDATQLILSDSIGNISFDKDILLQTYSIESRTEIKQLKLQQQENAFQIKKMKQNALPSVALIGYYAQLYQNDNFHYNDKWWAPHSYVGLQFSIPITGNFVNKNNIQEYKFKQQQLALDLQQKKSDVSYQIQKSETDLKNTLHNRQSAENNYALSQTIYRNQQKQFAIGVFKYSELLDTEKSLRDAERNYIKAVYDYLIAELQYAKSLGVL